MNYSVTKAFTLIEVMISLFVFSTGMLAFMAYHARANSMMFENESSLIAHSLALNLAEEINSLSPEDTRDLCDVACFSSGGTCQDALIANNLDKGGSFASGPFDSWGKPLGGSPNETFMFYRLILMSTYSQMTQTSNSENTQLGLLRHFEVVAAWPRKAFPSLKCSSLGNPDCNYVRVPVVKFISPVTP